MKIRVMTQGPWCLAFGGAEVQARKYVEYGQKIGLDLDFLDFYDRSHDFDILHFVGMNYSTSNYAAFARRHRKKIVISPVYYTSPRKELALSLALRLSKSHHIVSLNIFREALQQADVILPNSYAEQNQINRIFGLTSKNNRFEIIYNGVDRLAERPSPDEFRRQYGILDRYYLCVGMLDQRKNTLGLLKAFISANVKEKLVVIGDFRDADQSYNLKVNNLISANRERLKHIPFISSRSLLMSAYSGAVAHILPSLIETPGLSNLEAQAAGCPIIVGDCQPVREYFQDAAIYVPAGNLSSLVDVIEAYSSGSLISKAVETPNKYYWENIILRLSSAYEGLMC